MFLSGQDWTRPNGKGSKKRKKVGAFVGIGTLSALHYGAAPCDPQTMLETYIYIHCAFETYLRNVKVTARRGALRYKALYEALYKQPSSNKYSYCKLAVFVEV